MKASKIMWGLMLFDTLRYEFALFEPYLQQIEASNRRHYQTALSGSWRFRRDILTGLTFKETSTTDTDTVNTVLFDGCTAFFYTADCLTRSTPYTIEAGKGGWTFIEVNRFRIHFGDNSEKWAFFLKQKEGRWQLTVDPDPQYSRGSRLWLYEKMLPSIAGQGGALRP